MARKGKGKSNKEEKLEEGVDTSIVEKETKELKEVDESKQVEKSVKVEEEVKASKPIEVKEDKVKLQVVEDTKCCVGGKWYALKKDTDYVVSRDVEQVLREGHKLRIHS